MLDSRCRVHGERTLGDDTVGLEAVARPLSVRGLADTDPVPHTDGQSVLLEHLNPVSMTRYVAHSPDHAVADGQRLAG